MATALASSPGQANAIMNLNPSANLGGGNSPQAPLRTGAEGGIGGGSNPFLPAPVSGQTAPPITSQPAVGTAPAPAPFPANTPGGTVGGNPMLPAIGGTLGPPTTPGATGKAGYPTGTIAGASFADIGKGLSTAGYKG